MFTAITIIPHLAVAGFGVGVTGSTPAAIEQTIGQEILRLEALQHIVPVAVEVDQHLKIKNRKICCLNSILYSNDRQVDFECVFKIGLAATHS